MLEWRGFAAFGRALGTGLACEVGDDTFPLSKSNRAHAQKPEEGVIKQLLLPMLPQGATPINYRVGVTNQDGHWTYLLGMHPVYRHPAGDQRGFKLTIAQLVDCGQLAAAVPLASLLDRRSLPFTPPFPHPCRSKLLASQRQRAADIPRP